MASGLGRLRTVGVSAARRWAAPTRLGRGLVVAGLVLGACGGGTNVEAGRDDAPSTAFPTTVPVTTPTSTVTSTTGAPPSTAKVTTTQKTQKAAAGPFVGRDAPAGSAGDQVSFVQGAGDPPACQDIEPSGPSTPTVVPDRNYGGPGSVASHLIMCLPGFDAGTPVDAVITSPTGRTTRRTVVTSEGSVVYTVWLPRPGDALGRYTLTASQGRARATGAFTVGPPPGRQAIVLGRDARSTTPRAEAFFLYLPRDPVGAKLDVVLAGFAPNQQVKLKFYRRTDVEDSLTGELRATAMTSVNAQGETVYVLDTRGAERGTYMVRTEPGLESFTSPTFTLT